MTQNNGSLTGRNLYIPRMSIDGASAMAAVYRSFGINGQMLPAMDERSLDLAKQYTIGEECFPEIVTLGGFLKVIEQDGFKPEETAFMMPTTDGPCRFGQYSSLLKKILNDKGLEQVLVVAPSSSDGYDGIGQDSNDMIRMAWWGLVCADVLRKLLLQTRPYEINIGDTDQIHSESLEMLCNILERTDLKMKEKFAALIEVMSRITYKFTRIPAKYTKDKLLIGVVGEIYCRLDDFANADVIRKIEKFGGEVWLASIAEWVFYTNFLLKQDLKIDGQAYSKSMIDVMIKNKIQDKDEHNLVIPSHRRFIGYEEPKNTKSLLTLANKYLPYSGALGEMVLNIGGSIYLYNKGADGIIDISPFTCMNGIVCEAIYPKLSREHNNLPIRNFYFDGTGIDIDRDVEIFLELASTYNRRKKIQRKFPPHFA